MVPKRVNIILEKRYLQLNEVTFTWQLVDSENKLCLTEKLDGWMDGLL